MGKLRERTNKRSNRKRSNKRKNTKRTKKRENTKRTNKRSNRKRSKNTKRTRKIHKKGGCFSCSGRPKKSKLTHQTSVRLQRPVYDPDPDPSEYKPPNLQYMDDQMTIQGDHLGHRRAERNPIQQPQPQPQPQTQTQGPNHPGCEECLGRKNWLGHYTHNYCLRGEEKGTCYRINSDKFSSNYACDGGKPTSCSSKSSVSGCRGQDTYGHTCRNENWEL
jgi:hypothetical protein